MLKKWGIGTAANGGDSPAKGGGAVADSPASKKKTATTTTATDKTTATGTEKAKAAAAKPKTPRKKATATTTTTITSANGNDNTEEGDKSTMKKRGRSRQPKISPVNITDSDDEIKKEEDVDGDDVDGAEETPTKKARLDTPASVSASVAPSVAESVAESEASTVKLPVTDDGKGHGKGGDADTVVHTTSIGGDKGNGDGEVVQSVEVVKKEYEVNSDHDATPYMAREGEGEGEAEGAGARTHDGERGVGSIGSDDG